MNSLPTLLLLVSSLTSIAETNGVLDISRQHSVNPIGFTELTELVERGEFQPRTCVASLLTSAGTSQANPGYNQLILEAAAKRIEKMGYPKEIASQLFDFKVGLDGLERCLEGPYEDVTIISHDFSIGKAGVIMRELAEFDRDTGKYQVYSEAVPRGFFRAFTDGRKTVHPNVRQITLIVCGAEKVLRVGKSLRRLIRNYGLNIKLQPVDLLMSIAMSTQGKGYKSIRTGALIPTMIAENAQPEQMETLYCLVNTKVIIFGESGHAPCVRGRYHALVESWSVGLKYSNRLIQFSPHDYGTALRKTTGSLLSISSGRWIHLNLNSDDAGTDKGSVGYSVGIADRITVTDRSFCYDSTPIVRLACFGQRAYFEGRIFDRRSEPVEDGYNARDQFGNTALIIATLFDYYYFAKHILKKGADPNIQNNKGQNAVHFAAALGRTSIIRRFRGQTGYREFQDATKHPLELHLAEKETGNTPLHIAALVAENANNHAAANELLFEADQEELFIENADGETPGDILERSNIFAAEILRTYRYLSKR